MTTRAKMDIADLEDQMRSLLRDASRLDDRIEKLRKRIHRMKAAEAGGKKPLQPADEDQGYYGD